VGEHPALSCRESWSRLTRTTARTINVNGGVTGIVSCELYINAGKLGGLTCATQRVCLAKMDQVILSDASRDLKGRPDWARRDPIYSNTF
jgi:hypothetical protein